MLATTSSQNKPNALNSRALAVINPPILEVSQVIQESSSSDEIRITIPRNIQETLRINNEGNYLKQACFLRKMCGVLASTSVWIVLALNETEFDAKLESLFSIICCCLAYVTFENLFLCLARELPNEDYKERIFDVLDGILALYFMVIIMFCDKDTLGKYLLMVSLCLYLIITSIYVNQLEETSALKKCSKVFRKLLCCIQVWVISAKILGYITLGWMAVFMPLSLLLLGLQMYSSYALVKSAIQLFRNQMNAFQFVQRCVKMSWYVLYCGFYPLCLALLPCLCQEAENVENTEFMEILLTIAEYYCGFFFGYTLVFFKLMKTFNIDLRLEHQEEEIREEIQKKKVSIKIQKEGEVSFFKRISPTFFILTRKKEIKSETKVEQEEINDSRSTGVEEPLCYVCETNSPDVILMDCGHGGMCKDCLLLSMKKNNNCMECRRPVRSVYQITREEVPTGLVEAVEAFNIV